MGSAHSWDLFDILLINHYKCILCIGKGNSTELILKQQYPILKTIIPSLSYNCTTYLFPDNCTLYKVTVFLPGFHTLGCTGPIEKLKGVHEGETWVTSFRYR